LEAYNPGKQIAESQVMEMTLAEELSQYASAIKYSNIPGNIIHESKKRIIDALGCGIGAFNADPVKFSRKIAEKVNVENGSTLLGTKRKSTPDMASFVNGIMVRYFDYNDTYLSREPAHPSDNIGVCLSVADSENASGGELLLSVALAYEIQCRLCDAADIRHKGWDHVCYGLVSTALASGRLMNLNPRQMTQAVNLAVNFPYHNAPGESWRAFHVEGLFLRKRWPKRGLLSPTSKRGYDWSFTNLRRGDGFLQTGIRTLPDQYGGLRR
jgi:2-methylcitrate dehydratase PrpD